MRLGLRWLLSFAARVGFVASVFFFFFSLTCHVCVCFALRVVVAVCVWGAGGEEGWCCVAGGFCWRVLFARLLGQLRCACWAGCARGALRVAPRSARAGSGCSRLAGCWHRAAGLFAGRLPSRLQSVRCSRRCRRGWAARRPRGDRLPALTLMTLVETGPGAARRGLRPGATETGQACSCAPADETCCHGPRLARLLAAVAATRRGSWSGSPAAPLAGAAPCRRVVPLSSAV